MPVTRDDVIEAYRVFLGRAPESEAVITNHLAAHADTASLRLAFAASEEALRIGETPAMNEAVGTPWRAPLFLLAPPAAALVPWVLAPPSLGDPLSQLCTEAQLGEPLYATICEALAMPPAKHRKTWEFAWIAAVLAKAGMAQAGRRGLGFGVGGEPLPAYLAARGVAVLASDAPVETIEGQGWDTTGQHAGSLAPLRRPMLLPDAEFDRLVRFRPVDMNAIPDDLRDFDFCWSACAFEHLGSIEHGLRFVEESLKTLRPGGIAVHTTEFNLDSNEMTIESSGLSIFRKRDIERLLDRLARAGHKPWPLNVHPGSGPMDQHIDTPPYGSPHLKILVAGQVTTSIGIVLEKG